MGVYEMETIYISCEEEDRARFGFFLVESGPEWSSEGIGVYAWPHM